MNCPFNLEKNCGYLYNIALEPIGRIVWVLALIRSGTNISNWGNVRQQRTDIRKTFLNNWQRSHWIFMTKFPTALLFRFAHGENSGEIFSEILLIYGDR